MTVHAADKKRQQSLGKFDPPNVGPCDDVLWYQRGILNNRPVPAKVIYNNGGGNLCLFLYSKGMTIEGVRHANDPALRTMAAEARGCWRSREEFEASERKAAEIRAAREKEAREKEAAKAKQKAEGVAA